MNLGDDLLMALDPVRFAKRAGIEADGWQVDLLHSSAREILLNVHRQGGKSSIAAVLGVHQAIYVPRSLVLLVSPSQRQSAELGRKCRDIFHAVGEQIAPEAESVTRLELPNGSRILSLPGSEQTIRGFSRPDLIIEDEAARCEDALYRALRPMRATSQGRLILMSTPWGRRGHFFEEWENGGRGWLRVRATADQCSRITPEFLDAERRSLGAWHFEQEYMATFGDSTTSAFSYADIHAAVTPGLRSLWREQ